MVLLLEEIAMNHSAAIVNTRSQFKQLREPQTACAARRASVEIKKLQPECCARFIENLR
jgi:hypothetical protein